MEARTPTSSRCILLSLPSPKMPGAGGGKEGTATMSSHFCTHTPTPPHTPHYTLHLGARARRKGQEDITLLQHKSTWQREELNEVAGKKKARDISFMVGQVPAAGS